MEGRRKSSSNRIVHFVFMPFLPCSACFSMLKRSTTGLLGHSRARELECCSGQTLKVAFERSHDPTALTTKLRINDHCKSELYRILQNPSTSLLTLETTHVPSLDGISCSHIIMAIANCTCREQRAGSRGHSLFAKCGSTNMGPPGVRPPIRPQGFWNVF